MSLQQISSPHGKMPLLPPVMANPAPHFPSYTTEAVSQLLPRGTTSNHKTCQAAEKVFNLHGSWHCKASPVYTISPVPSDKTKLSKTPYQPQIGWDVKLNHGMRTAFKCFLLIFLHPGIDSPNILLKPYLPIDANARSLPVLLEKAVSHPLTPSKKHIKNAAICCCCFSFFLSLRGRGSAIHHTTCLASIFMSTKFDQFPQKQSPPQNTKSISSCGENPLVKKKGKKKVASWNLD